MPAAARPSWNEFIRPCPARRLGKDHIVQNSPDILKLIARGDVSALRAALEDGADANHCDRWGVSALARAAGLGDLEALVLLLDHGADVNRSSDAGNTALMAAAACGHLDAVMHLLEAGADPTHRNRWGLGAEDWTKWPENASELRAVLRSRLG